MRALITVALALPACADTQPGGPEIQATSSTAADEETASSGSGGVVLQGTTSLIDLAAFEKTPRDQDPFDDRPSDVVCEFGYGLEDGLFELESDLCRYGGFVQPSLAPVRVGDTLELLLLHDNLVSDDPDAQAHVAIALGDDVVWETTIDIPAEASFIGPSWTSTVDAPAGTPVHVHVHNHGVNSYRLTELTVTYAET